MTNQKYHLYFKEEDFNPNLITYLRVLIKEKHFFKMNEQQKKESLNELNIFMSSIYNISISKIVISDLLPCAYWFDTEKISLNKPSLVSFLHEFKHHINHKLNLPNTEESARGFSHALYYIATPKLFESAVNKGLLIWQKSI